MKVINCNKVLESNTTEDFAEISNDGGDILILDVGGSCSSMSLEINGRMSDDTGYKPVPIFVDESFLTLEDNYIQEKGIYQIPIYAYSTIKINVDTVSGGNVSVFAKIVQEV